MNRIVVCLDSPNYRKGGYCTLKQKDVGALNPACENAGKTASEVQEEKRSVLTKKCCHCLRELPIDSFALNRKTSDGRQNVCRECSAEMYKDWDRRRKERKRMDKQAIAAVKNETDCNNVIKSKKMEKLAPTKETKLCTKCGRELPISEFYAKTGTKDGLAYRCKECHTVEVIESRARKKAKAQPAPAQESKPVVVCETLTDKQMVEALRAHGWTVTCTRKTTEEL